jgi:hypothetical protein
MNAKQETPVETDGVVGVSLVSCMLFKEAPSTHMLFRVAELKKEMEKYIGTCFNVRRVSGK